MIRCLLTMLLLGFAAVAQPAAAQTEGNRADAVVELYTSQGCSQCPRANRLLGGFARQDRILALTFPVGIWDYLGWHDTFARPEFAERQRRYARSIRGGGRFTPQLVINGAHQISASDWDEAHAVFDRVRTDGWPARAPELAIARLRNNRARVTIGAREQAQPADVWLLAYDPGPITVVITGGVNINRSVAHYNLVKWIERLETWNGQASWHERARCQPECAVLIQEPNGGPIVAAAFTYRDRY